MARREDNIIDLADFSKGFSALEDTTKAPFGSFRKMKNAQVTDRGGIGPRPGTTLLGTKNTSTYAVKGFYNYKKSHESNEILIKNYDDEQEGYAIDQSSAGWFRIKDGYTQDKEFGYVHSLFNTSSQNLVIGGNQYDPFFEWTGELMTLNGALVGAESTLTVDTTLRADVYESATATGSSTTTLTVSTATWATDQWNGFYVHITSGAQSGVVKKITDTTGTVITFGAITDPGLATFEIKRMLIPETGTVIYNGTSIAYTAVPTATGITVASAHAGSDGDVVTLVPTEYNANPRANRFTNYLGRIIAGAVRSALSRDSGGTLEGYASGGSYFTSKLNDPTDFTFTATRVAGEGDINAAPYGGGDITDVVAQEKLAYVFKRDYIEAVEYSQDANDFAVREPLRPGIGSIGKTTQGPNDVYFMTTAKQITTIGRVRTKDIRPETLNVGNSIKRWLDQANGDSIGRGIHKAGKIYFPVKSNATVAYNDVLLVYNENTKSFEGIWDLAAFGLVEWNGKYYYAESTGANVYQMFADNFVDTEGANEFGYTFDVATHFFNLTPSNAYQQSVHGLVIEGYIRGGTTITYNLWKDLSTTPSVTFTFAADETGYLDGDNSNIFLGDKPIGVNGLTIDQSDIDADGRRHFSARIYFPFIYGNSFSAGISSSGINQDHETSRLGVMLAEELGVNTNKIKSI
jgi:hypothetical protein